MGQRRTTAPIAFSLTDPTCIIPPPPGCFSLAPACAENPLAAASFCPPIM
jgi:hypothetical protein